MKPPLRSSLSALALLLAATVCTVAGQATTPAPASSLSVGPWGTLKISPISLAAPESTVRPFVFFPAGVWSFGKDPWPSVEAFIRAAPLTAAQREQLLDPDRRTTDPATGDLLLNVPDSLRLELSPAARETVYRRLARYSANIAHYLPYIITSDAVIEKAALNPPLRARLLQLEFQRGRRRSMADADLLAPLARDEAELLRLKRIFYTYPGLAVELTRASLADPAQATAYWSRPDGTPGPDWVKRFQRSPDVESIDLAALLPPLPRSLLNSFPDDINCPLNANCFWMSLNFFRPKADHRVLPQKLEADESGPLTLEELSTRYDRVEPPYRYGDVIVIFDQDGDAYSLSHAVVYLADGIVFTKNGAGPFSPFQLARLDQVLAFYDWAFDLHVQGYRLRPDTRALPALPR